MKDVMLERPPEKLLSFPPDIKEKILNYLFENGVEHPIPMNNFLEQFEVDKLERFVVLFSEFENKQWVRCNGNFGWLGSRNDGELLDLSHPLTQFSCQLLQPGIEYIQKKNQELHLIEEHFSQYEQHKYKIPWYEHWLFWLIVVSCFMAGMIFLVETRT